MGNKYRSREKSFNVFQLLGRDFNRPDYRFSVFMLSQKICIALFLLSRFKVGKSRSLFYCDLSSKTEKVRNSGIYY